jgi:valyl-tRNA synthetase
VERQFQNFQYGQAGQQIYDFIWSDFADWYVEIAKGQMQKRAESRMQTVKLSRVFLICPCACFIHLPRLSPKKFGDISAESILESPISDVAKDWPDALIVAKFPEPRDVKAGKRKRSQTSR